MRKLLLPLILALAAGPTPLFSQTGFIDAWQARVNKTQAEQPHWVTPLVTVTPRLEQELRTDFVRQVTPKLTDTWVYGNGKGLELIPERHIELLANIPPYLSRETPHTTTTRDGFGDASFVMKYRFLARNEEQGNAIITAFLGGSIPTGSYTNGSSDAIVTPTLAGGKGFGRLSVQSTAGVALPVENTKKLGRPVAWNTALQYKVDQHTWPELEFNTTYYNGGPNDGKVQNFITPGLVERFHLHNRIGLTLGAGMQIATSEYHSYNHALLFTARMPF